MSLNEILGSVELGLIYGLVAIGVYLTFRIIDFPDLTVDGSYPLGGAIGAAMIVAGFNPYVATVTAFFGGAAAGSVTAYLNTRWGIMGLLAGILTMTGLYSINLRIMGRPNVALLTEETVFTPPNYKNWNIDPTYYKYFIIVGFVGIVFFAIVYFLNSEMGLAIRATGSNAKVARAQGVHVNRMIFLTLALSNGIVAVAGALFVQAQGFADITLGPGTIIVGLASVIIGEAILRTRNLGILIFSSIVGSIIYQIAIAMALNVGDIGLKASDLKLITALLIGATMILPKLKAKSVFKKSIQTKPVT